MFGFKELNISTYNRITVYDGIIQDVDKLTEQERESLYVQDLLPVAKEYINSHPIEWFINDETGEKTTQDIEVYELDDCLYLITRTLVDKQLVKKVIAWTYTPDKYIPVINDVSVVYLNPEEDNDRLYIEMLLVADLLSIPWDPDDIPAWIDQYRQEHGNSDAIRIFFTSDHYFVFTISNENEVEIQDPEEFVKALAVQY